ncbi:MAG TPA: substrate-binding domain-containing protein [Casimicrobiaceae bacterium]|nr:substrate-binding domain-containing protein [Casimicrobiaceae bacterium]
MRLSPHLDWTYGDPPRPLDPRLVPLLRAIANGGSLAAAIHPVGLSYRAAWGLLRDYEQAFGAALVDLERGRGATVAPLGQELLAAQEAAMERFAPLARELTRELGGASSRTLPRALPLHLRVAASHDLALAAAREDLARHGLDLDLAFMGSVHALEAFRAGSVDVAGFHLSVRTSLRGKAQVLRRLLRARRDRLIAFVEREQGLMLARSHARQVRTLADIAARGLVFVNRQRGSGTRLIIDALLQRERIAPADLRGYANEEFTHRAVAATIASGGAQAGFGLQAAAEEYDLAFVPLLRETYYLAVGSSALRELPLQRLVAYLASPAFGAIVQRLPGYRARGAGTVLDLDVME